MSNMNWHEINERTKRLKSEWEVSVKKSDREDAFWSASAKIVFFLNIFAPIVTWYEVGIIYSEFVGFLAFIALSFALLCLMWFTVKKVNRRKYR